jgi:hypothetical protein
MRAEIRALRSEVERLTTADANRERRLNLLGETVEEMAKLCQKLHGSLGALQQAVEGIVGIRRN